MAILEKTFTDIDVESTDQAELPQAKPSSEQIALLAFTFFREARQGKDGSAEDDWFRAERELSH